MSYSLNSATKKEYIKKRAIIQEMLSILQDDWEPAESLATLASSTFVTPAFLDIIAEMLFSAVEEADYIKNIGKLKKLSASLVFIRDQEQKEREMELGKLISSVDCL